MPASVTMWCAPLGSARARATASRGDVREASCHQLRVLVVLDVSQLPAAMSSSQVDEAVEHRQRADREVERVELFGVARAS